MNVVLKNTFIHVSGVGFKMEESLWASGILSWDDIDNICPLVDGMTKKRYDSIKNCIYESQDRFSKGDVHYFAHRIDPVEYWRFLPEFRPHLAYVDIETTGLDKYYEEVTTIALLAEGKIRYYIWGINIDEFIQDIKNYPVLVTYNGKLFDVPFIEHKLKIRMNQVHIDLRWILKKIGIRGGLKKSEKYFGIERGELEEVNGKVAPGLWREYHDRNNRSALEVLLAYNILDVLNLEKLFVMTYNKNIMGTPFENKNKLMMPDQPKIPFDLKENLLFKSKKFSNRPKK